MKTEIIVDVFFQKNQLEQAIMNRVLDSINDFKRRTELRLSYREMKEVYDEYQKAERTLVSRLIEEFCTKQNELNKEAKNWKELTIEEFNRVPPQKMKEYSDEVEKLKDADISFRKPLKFYEDELTDEKGKPKFKFTEEELLKDFVMWGKNKPKPKPKVKSKDKK